VATQDVFWIQFLILSVAFYCNVRFVLSICR
jgi:hypothetical protein